MTPIDRGKKKGRPLRRLSEDELKILKNLCHLQCTYGEICLVFSMSKATLMRMRRENESVTRAMDSGYGWGRVRLRKHMFKSAETDPIMQIFLAKKYLRFPSPSPPIEGPGGLGQEEPLSKTQIEEARQRLVDIVFGFPQDQPMCEAEPQPLETDPDNLDSPNLADEAATEWSSQVGSEVTNAAQPEQSGSQLDSETLIELHRDYIRSAQASDVDWFERHLAHDFVCSQPDGSLVDRRCFLQQTTAPAKISNAEAQDVMVRPMGKFAILHARTNYTLTDGRSGWDRYSTVWAHRQGRWLAVSAHVTCTEP
jgi:hypothetical protein